MFQKKFHALCELEIYSYENTLPIKKSRFWSIIIFRKVNDFILEKGKIISYH